jgi:hypothetical protein
MRTKPLYADWVDLGDDRTRNFGPRGSILVPPGTYTVVLEAAGQAHKQELVVLKDPNSEGSEADIMAQSAMMREVWADLNTAADMVNRIELIRRQIYDLKAIAKDLGEDKNTAESVDALDRKLLDVEEKLIQMRVTGTGQDRVRWPARLVGRIAYLGSTVEVADFPPTDQQREVHRLLKQRLEQYQAELDNILQTDLPPFNRMLQEVKLTSK